METEAKANLNELAAEISRQEGLAQGIGIGQVKEVLALLGIRWRNMSLEDAMMEINCLITRGGKLSEHKKGMLLEATADVEKESYSREEDKSSGQ